MNQRLLIDENVPFYLVDHLRRLGHDLLHVRDVRPGLADEEVLALAVRDARILVTFDRGYGDLTFRQGLDAPPAVVYVRLSPAARARVSEAVAAVLGSGDELLVGRLVVLTAEGIRSRPFPPRTSR